MRSTGSQAKERPGVVLQEGIATGFPRTARLLTARDYGTVFQKNRRLSDKYWTVLVHQSESASPRLGMAIAKKRAKRAVDRNRIKRIARESFRHQLPNLSHIELVIMNRQEAVSASNNTLRASLDILLSRII